MLAETEFNLTYTYGQVVARLQASYSVPEPGPVHNKDIHRPVTKIKLGVVCSEAELS